MFQELSRKKTYLNILDGLDPEKVIPFETYLNLLSLMAEQSYRWPVARRIEICKNFSRKKRIVYAYPREEMFILRAVNHYLFEKYHEDLSVSYFPSRRRTPSQCLSFILESREAYLRARPQLPGIHGMHLDISDYFNSMDPHILFERLPKELRADQDFVWLYRNTLLNPWCTQQGKLVRIENKGAMAGLPFTAFFAARYLHELDRSFEVAGIPYARYSDDIIFFVESQELLAEGLQRIKTKVQESELVLNEDKTEHITVQQPWTFIGFEVEQSRIDISKHQHDKLKRRISKWARRYRKRVEVRYGLDKRCMTPERAVASLIRNINRALFKPVRDKYCWAQWAFPTINTLGRIQSLDRLIQEKLRYVYTGGYSKKNFRILPYQQLKEMGYYSLEKLYLLFRYSPEKFHEFIEDEVCRNRLNSVNRTD